MDRGQESSHVRKGRSLIDRFRARVLRLLVVVALSLAGTSSVARAQGTTGGSPPEQPSPDEAGGSSAFRRTVADDGSDTPKQDQVAAERPVESGSTADAPIDAIELFDLEVPIVVTALRHESSGAALPYAISVITAEDIRQAGVSSVPEALRLVPGVDVAQLSETQFAVAPRGFHGYLSRQVLVLVDGRQIFDAHFGGTSWGVWPFMLEDIERIEVIRGPAGVVWGANAVNGVINVITKKPADQLGTTVTLTGGSRGTHKEYVGHAFTDDKLSLRVSAEYDAGDGFNEGGSILRKLTDEHKTGRLGIFATYQESPRELLTISAGSGIVDGGFPSAPLSGFGQTTNPSAQANYILGKWSKELDAKSKVEITAFVNDLFGSPGIPQIDYRYQQFALQFGHTFQPCDNHTMTWGVDTRSDLLDASNADPQMLSREFLSTGTIGIYAQDQWRFDPKWSLELGGRLDYEFYGGFQPSARAAIVRELSAQSNVYFAVSRAFQMPPVGLRFLNMPFLNGLAWSVGERGVDPESLVAYELGYRRDFLSRIHTSATLFWHEYDRTTTLSPQLGPPGLVAFKLGNRGDASLYGVELNAKYRVANQLTVFGNYTFQEFDWRSSVAFHDKDLMSPPRHKAMVGLTYNPVDRLHLSSYLYATDHVNAPNATYPFAAREIDSYLRLDLRAEYELEEGSSSLAFGVRNLTDRNHPEGGTLFQNDAEVPRMVYAELRVSIKNK